MKKVRESKLEKAFVEFAKFRGCKVLKLSDLANPKAPDRLIICPNGITAYLELKRPDEEPDEGQERFIMWLKDNGHEAGWTDDLEDAKNWLGRILRKK